ncbi:ETS translocation variant 1 [Thelohanellus kitauei]|uniref:ETS translocation variant 1 n=1 Tax=Thelohanellus kitauei TaxID=669202 RepID=A0A0C2JGN6_THEKT|nr:ETS translocation variant 1 [Thelohanellus kitauei]
MAVMSNVEHSERVLRDVLQQGITQDTKLKLWQFIICCLNDPRMNSGELGHFRIINGERLARQWGLHKNNNRMTYSKMCRSLRNYQSEGIILKLQRNRREYAFNFQMIYVSFSITNSKNSVSYLVFHATTCKISGLCKSANVARGSGTQNSIHLIVCQTTGINIDSGLNYSIPNIGTYQTIIT